MTLYEMSEGALALYEMFYNGDIDEETLNDTIESFGVEDKLEDYCKLIRQLGADVIAMELDDLGFHIDAINEADIFFQIDEAYRSAVAGLKKEAKSMLDSALNAEERKQLKQEIARQSKMYDFTKQGILESFWAGVKFNNTLITESNDPTAQMSNYHSGIYAQMMKMRH